MARRKTRRKTISYSFLRIAFAPLRSPLSLFVQRQTVSPGSALLRQPAVRNVLGVRAPDDNLDFDIRDGLPSGPAHRRAAGLNPGNRFENLRLHVLGDEL